MVSIRSTMRKCMEKDNILGTLMLAIEEYDNEIIEYFNVC